MKRDDESWKHPLKGKEIVIYTIQLCAPCRAAKWLLNEQGIPFEEIDIERGSITRDNLEALTGGRTVPQIVVDGKAIGGYHELYELISKETLII